MEEERAQKIKQIEKKKNDKIEKLTNNHLKKYGDIKAYYADITAQNLDLIKTLKNTINDLRRHEEQDKKLLQQIEKEFKNLNDPLRALNEEIKMLKEMKVENENIVNQKAEIKKAIEAAEIFFRKLEYEYEVKFQQYQFLKKERDLLYGKFNDCIYEIHQKSGLKVIFIFIIIMLYYDVDVYIYIIYSMLYYYVDVYIYIIYSMLYYYVDVDVYIYIILFIENFYVLTNFNLV